MRVLAPDEEQFDIRVTVRERVIVFPQTRTVPALPLTHGSQVPHQNPQHGPGQAHQGRTAGHQGEPHLPALNQKGQNGGVRRLRNHHRQKDPRHPNS